MSLQALFFLLGSQVCEDRRPEPADPGSYGKLLGKPNLGAPKEPFRTSGL